jgi:hypothetical protein
MSSDVVYLSGIPFYIVLYKQLIFNFKFRFLFNCQNRQVVLTHTVIQKLSFE